MGDQATEAPLMSDPAVHIPPLSAEEAGRDVFKSSR
jgi:hypothetical protein